MDLKVVMLPDQVMCGECGRAMHQTGSWEVNPNRPVYACTNGRCTCNQIKVEVPSLEVMLPRLGGV